jgi:moderate conductance mechanosensitive channel
METGLFSGPVDRNAVFTAVGATLLMSVLAALVAKRLTERALTAAVGDHLTVSSPLVQGPLRLVAIVTFFLTASLLLFPAFELAGLRPRTGVPLSALASWSFGHGLRVLLIASMAYALIKATALLVRRFEYRVGQGTSVDALERAKRARTLGSLIQKVSTIVISSVAALMILDEFDVYIAPVLTGAGIAGLALGFGAQTLVRDIISGFFMILEDQVRVGDVAAINGIGGLVEQINLRTIVLRDEEGAVHVFPNGAITTLANRSKDFSYYVITLSVPYQEDPDRIVQILRDVGDDLQQDHRFGSFILEPIEILGLDAFADWAMQIKLRIKTVPLRQWEVGRELRKRIRKALSAAGMPIPYPAIAATAPPPPERQ